MDRGFIDLTIVSGSDIKRASLFPEKKVAVAWVDPERKQSTKAATGDASAPEWNDRLILQLGDMSRLLTIEIRSKGAFGDTLVGTVHVPVAHLTMDGNKEGKKKLTYLVDLPSGKRHGSLSLFAKIVHSQSNAAHPPAAAPVTMSLPEKFSSHAPSQINVAPAPVLYPPVESYRAEQYQTVQPYPPAESFYPPPYPSSRPALGSMQPTYPGYESVSNYPPPRIPSEYSYASLQYDCGRPTPYPPPAPNEYPTPYPPPAPNEYPTPYPPPAPHEYSVTSYPPAAPHEYSVTAYPPAAPHEYPLTRYPPAASIEYPATAYPPRVPYCPPVAYPPSQAYSYSSRYPPLCGSYPYPSS